jgi:ATP-dependent DNA helicase RecQ
MSSPNQPPTGLERARVALREHFGHADFRPHQAAAIEAVLAGRDVLVTMPTGAGKSLLYQLPAVCLDGLTLVISPLIALMKDQVDAAALDVVRSQAPCCRFPAASYRMNVGR